MNTKFEIENLSIIYTVDQGNLKILLIKKKEDPYKGYWIFPSKTLLKDETFFQNSNKVLSEFFHIDDLYKEHFISFIDEREEKVIETTVLCYMDEVTKNYMVKETEEYEWDWFEVINNPKMAFNYEDILKQSYEYVKRQMKETDVIKKLYPSDFTVAELQNLVEQITDKEIDRNSFRNKLVSSDIIEDTEQTDIASSGRPAKLYQFKEDADIGKIF